MRWTELAVTLWLVLAVALMCGSDATPRPSCAELLERLRTTQAYVKRADRKDLLPRTEDERAELRAMTVWMDKRLRDLTVAEEAK